VLSGKGLCDELITRPEEFYRLWCVVVCDLETSWMRRPWPTAGLARQKQTNCNKNCRNTPKCYLYVTHIVCLVTSTYFVLECTVSYTVQSAGYEINVQGVFHFGPCKRPLFVFI